LDDDNRITTPRPDPTLLTTAQLLREIDGLRSVVRGWVDNLQVLLETQLIGSVKTISTRLDGNDTALVAALQAQKEAAAKQTENFTAILDESKRGTTKQIDALNEKIDDIKDRMTRFEGIAGGRQGFRTEGHETQRNTLAGVAIVVAIIMGFLGFLFGHQK